MSDYTEGHSMTYAPGSDRWAYETRDEQHYAPQAMQYNGMVYRQLPKSSAPSKALLEKYGERSQDGVILPTERCNGKPVMVFNGAAYIQAGVSIPGAVNWNSAEWGSVGNENG